MCSRHRRVEGCSYGETATLGFDEIEHARRMRS